MNADDSLETAEAAEQKGRALEILLEAWETGLSESLDPEMLASTALFVAIAEMVEIYGPEAIAQMVGELPERIRAGEFTMLDEESEAEDLADSGE